MRRPTVAIAGILASVVLSAIAVSGLPTPVDAANQPEPAATSTSNVTVVIPELSPSPTPTRTSPSPSPSPSRSSGGGTSGGGTGTVTPTPAPSNPDGSPVPPAEPTEGAGKLKLDKSSLSAHDWMVATGTGYQPGEKVQFVLYPGAIIIGSFVADETGTVVARFRIPDDTRSGDHTVEATGWLSKKVENESFVVTSVAAAADLWLWWVVLVVGVLLASIIALAIYYRESIRGWFGGTAASGATP